MFPFLLIIYVVYRKYSILNFFYIPLFSSLPFLIANQVFCQNIIICYAFREMLERFLVYSLRQHCYFAVWRSRIKRYHNNISLLLFRIIPFLSTSITSVSAEKTSNLSRILFFLFVISSSDSLNS